jgi:hypothetical protein
MVRLKRAAGRADVMEKGVTSMRRCVLPIALLVMTCCDNDNGPSPTGPGLSFFVTSATSRTGNLGGLPGADATCQRLASAVGQSACSDWTSDSASLAAQVGHSDGMGPNQSTTAPLASWNSAHASQNCADTAPRGGAGRFYCFAR